MINETKNLLKSLDFLPPCGHTVWAHKAMTTMKTARLWMDPRTGIWKLRRRIPQRYRSVADQTGDSIKISTGHADRKAAESALPAVLQRWEDMLAGWERRSNVVTLTPERAATLAAQWAAWVAGGGRLDTGDETSDVFEPLDLPECATPERVARMWDRVEWHADEALQMAGITIAPEGRPLLLRAMVRTVAAAYLQADLVNLGVTGSAEAVRPLDMIREALPAVPDTVPVGVTAPAPKVSLVGLFNAWKAIAVVKPRTVTEADYAVKALAAFAGHDDAAQITRDDLARWRDAMIAEGRVNGTWNNRLSLIRQVLLFGVSERRLAVNPTEGLRLKKNRQKSPLPYSDDDAVRLLTAARKESRPSLRWAHWVMAFTGMRAGETLQLLGRDVGQDGNVWYLDVNEDDPTKSVKTGQRRRVPVHPALIREGFFDYARTIAADAPLFPDKGLDRHGLRGGRAWNVVGKWARITAAITDPAKAPDHSWRHRIEDELRAAEVPEDVRDAILGHSRKTTGRQYGVRAEALARLHRSLSLVPTPPGLFPNEALRACVEAVQLPAGVLPPRQPDAAPKPPRPRRRGAPQGLPRALR